MSSTIDVKHPAGPEGAALPPDALSRPSGSVRFYFANFMLEDYIDAAEARAALEDPANAERVPWEQLKERLGL